MPSYCWFRLAITVSLLYQITLQACHYTCTTCSAQDTANACLTCNDATTNRQLTASNTCQCKIGYGDTATTTICTSLTCANKCKTCQHTTDNCITCEPTNHREQVGNDCPCKPSFYDASSAALCEACDPTCLTCQTSSTHCLTCDGPTHFRSISGSNTCDCIAGYYDSTATICSKCSHKCTLCSSGTACDSCATSTNARLSAPNCLCPDRFYDDGANAQCVACHHSCLKCVNPNTCQTCQPTDHRTMGSNGVSTCVCLPNYYDDNTNALCADCAAACLTCLGPADTECLSCNNTAKRVLNSGTGKCDCDLQYYETSNTVQECAACHSTCLTCSGPASNQCLSCDSLQKRNVTLSSSSCVCQDGYYQDSNNLCRLCHWSCLTCTSYDQCTTCVGAHSTTHNTTTFKCECTSLQFWSAADTACQSCNYRCQTCSQAATNCTSCPSVTREYQPTANTCACKKYYYDAGGAACTACHVTCDSCSSAAATGCVTCSALNHRYKTAANECKCMNGYYENGTVTRVCKKCHYSCLTCTDGSACTGCDSTALRTLDTGVTNLCLCNAKYFQNSTTLACDPCLYHCETCAANNQCLTCNAAMFRVENVTTDLCVCQNKYYDDGVHQLCVGCLYDCLTCTNGTKCVSCDATLNRVLSATFRCPCKVRYYEDGSQVCQACHYSCLTCSAGANTNCLTCNATAFRYKSGTSCLCLAGYYDDTSTQLCKPCSYKCQTCIDAATCTICDIGTSRALTGAADASLCQCPAQRYYDDGTQFCKSCQYTCKTCTNATKCDTCDDTALINRQIDSNNIYCKCKIQFYDDGLNNQDCKACPYQCATCTNSTVCATCNIAKFRHLPAQKCPCIDRYYTVVGTQQCSPCLYHCKTCTTNTKCTTCDANNYRVFNFADKKCYCMDKFYDDGTNTNELCLPCDYTCATCQGTSTHCLTCNVSAYRNFTTNTCPCFQYYYDDLSNEECLACHYSCATCTDSVTCATCDAAKFREAIASSDVCVCQQGYYDDGNDNQLCLKCHDSCLECTNNTACTDCDISRNRELNSTAGPLCVCIYEHYDLGASLNCAPCHYSCQVCTGPSDILCTQCDAAQLRTINASAGTCPCNEGFYDDEHSVCQPCVYSCQTCSAAIVCITCNNTAQRTFNSGANTCDCAPKYYDDNTNSQQCQPCHYSCKTCTDANDCATCQTATKHRIDNPSGFYCICQQGYYDDNTNSQLCGTCDSSCVACTNGTACTSCDAAIKMVLNSTADYSGTTIQLCQCQYGHFSPGAGQMCQLCHYTCEVCSADTASDCLACDSVAAKRVVNPVNGQCPCQNGWYDTQASQEICAACDPLCSICTNAGQHSCTACAANIFLLLSTTSCYSTCPSQYFNQVSTHTCQPCSQYCITCDNSSHCTSCTPNFPLYKNQCLVTCPTESTYENTTSNICIDCPDHCLTCQSNVKCLTCVLDYYLDQLVPLCFACNQYCKGCFGPAYNQCLDCEYPLYFNNSQCWNISCPYGQYVHSRQGCVDCTATYPNSLTCNINEAILCKDTFKLNNGQCVACESASGYQLTNTSDCSQICGDGVLYDYQCDDGNKQDGDGCSSNCITQAEWSCTLDANRKSICQLTGTVTLTLDSIYKYGGQNKIKIKLNLNLPLKLTQADFRLLIDQSTENFTWVFIQDASLKAVQFNVSYGKAIKNRQMRLIYGVSTSRRLLQVSINLEEIFIIDSYPPADYYTDEKIAEYNTIQESIRVLCIILMVLCAFCLIFPRRMYLSIFTFACIPAQIYIAYGISAQNITDWIKSSLRISQPSLIFGFNLYQCCSTSQFLNYSTNLSINSGIILVIMLALWLSYGILIILSKNFCSINPKVNMYFRYMILTLQLCTLSHLSFSAVNSLYNSSLTSSTQTSNAINICIGIFMNIYILAFLIGLWILCYWTDLIQYENNDQFHIIQQQSEEEEKNSQGRIKNPDYFFEFDKKTNSNDSIHGGDTSKDFIHGLTNRSVMEKSLEIKQPREANDVSEDNQDNNVHHSSIYKKIEESYLKEWLIYDYIEGYSSLRKTSKYWLPFAASKIYLLSLICSVSQANLIILFSLLLALQVASFIFLCAIRPFRLTYTTIKHIILSLCFIALDIVMIVYSVQASQNLYDSQIQYSMLIIIACTLGIAIALIIVDMFAAWRFQIWNRIQPCLVALRLRNPRKVLEVHQKFERPAKKKREVVIRDIQTANIEHEHAENEPPKKQTEQEQKEQLDAFFARMLKKQQLQRQYRRQRLLKHERINL